MGWSFRKSFRAGPFRVNLGKSGVGVSVGGKGFRTGINSRGRKYTSISLPGTGLRHVSHGPRAARGCLIVIAVGSAISTYLLYKSEPWRYLNEVPIHSQLANTTF